MNERHASVAFAAAAFVAASSEAATCAAWSRTWSADCWAAAASFTCLAAFNLHIVKPLAPGLVCENQLMMLANIALGPPSCTESTTTYRQWLPYLQLAVLLAKAAICIWEKASSRAHHVIPAAQETGTPWRKVSTRRHEPTRKQPAVYVLIYFGKQGPLSCAC